MEASGQPEDVTAQVTSAGFLEPVCCHTASPRRWWSNVNTRHGLRCEGWSKLFIANCQITYIHLEVSFFSFPVCLYSFPIHLYVSTKYCRRLSTLSCEPFLLLFSSSREILGSQPCFHILFILLHSICSESLSCAFTVTRLTVLCKRRETLLTL